MKKHIHKYLNEYFRIENNNVRRNQKYNEFIIPSFVVIKELDNIFSLEKNELKWYIKSWARKQSKSFSFNIWWTPKPIRGKHLLDAGYVYAPYIPVLQTPKVVEWDHAIPDRLVSRYTTRYVNPNYFR